MKLSLLFLTIPIMCFPFTTHCFKHIQSQKIPFQMSVIKGPHALSDHTKLSDQPKLSIQNKTNQFLKLIRAKNIIPTLFLSGSGGWLMNPSVSSLLHSKSYIVSSINTFLIMSASMIINDLFDLEIDKINNPERPLVTGAITKSEAIVTTLLLTGISEYLNIVFLPSNLQPIIHLSVLFIYLYTPLFKKIMVIKNISCAAIVSFSLFFSALSACQTQMVLNNKFDLLIVGCNLVFTGSWTNEILLDIRDYEGDKKQKLKTLPTILGKETSWTCAGLVLYIGVAVNAMKLVTLFNFPTALCFIGCVLPQFYYLFKIKKDEYSNKSIKKYMKHTNITLILLLLYLVNMK